jgi:hypothetical protein
VTARWREANAYWSEINSQLELVRLLSAAQRTADAAEAVTKHLRTFKDEIYGQQREGDRAQFKTEKEYQDSFFPVRDGFLHAAKKELGIAEIVGVQ